MITTLPLLRPFAFEAAWRPCKRDAANIPA